MSAPVPVPIDLPEPSPWVEAARVAKGLGLVARHVGPAAPRPSKRALARGFQRVCTGMGGTPVKLGQLVASSPSLFGEEVSEEFRGCLDRGPPVRTADVHGAIGRGLGIPATRAFRRIDPVPLGRASLAVVHRAETWDGRLVAVKVLRPGIERLVASDLAVLRRVFTVAARRVNRPELPDLLPEILSGLREQLTEELNLANEARTMTHFRDLYRSLGFERVVVPEVVEELSGRRVLTMELLDGIPVDDFDEVARRGVDAAPLVEEVVRAWFTSALADGVFHGDVHAGNLMLLRDGRIALIDWGIVGRLPAEGHRLFRNVIAGCLGDEAAWDAVAADLVGIFAPQLAGSVDAIPPEILEAHRRGVEDVLTRPLGEISLAKVIMDGMALAERAEGELRAAGTSLGDVPFDRHQMLLGKQLLYFERYGRAYVPDRSLLEDREAFSRVLAGS